jgi:hypothetical protein
MKLPNLIFLVAAVYGLALLVPMFFMEEYLSENYPPAITHPEYYYGFVGAAGAWQLVYLLIGTNPLRFRPLIPVAILAKLAFGITAWVLFSQGRTPGNIVAGATVDILFAVAFAYAYMLLGRPEHEFER